MRRGVCDASPSLGTDRRRARPPRRRSHRSHLAPTRRARRSRRIERRGERKAPNSLSPAARLSHDRPVDQRRVSALLGLPAPPPSPVPWLRRRWSPRPWWNSRRLRRRLVPALTCWRTWRHGPSTAQPHWRWWRTPGRQWTRRCFGRSATASSSPAPCTKWRTTRPRSHRRSYDTCGRRREGSGTCSRPRLPARTGNAGTIACLGLAVTRPWREATQEVPGVGSTRRRVQ